MIIDSISQMNIEVEDLISKNANDFEISKVFKNYIKEYINSIDTTVNTTGGKDLFVKHTKKTDKFLISLYKYILRKHFGSYQPMSTSIPITLVALGSYGREQLCIYSDVDLMILYEEVKGYNLKDIMEEFITLAWDCGLKLGSRVHALNEIEAGSNEDITIKTSMIESRLIYGSKHLWYAYENVLRRIRLTDQREFVEEKTFEHKTRLLKYPLCMQPNIKDGYGGLREANMVYWVANVLYGVSKLKDLMDIEFSEQEYRVYRTSLEYIFQVRNHLHNIAKKKLDIVTFDVLPELSDKLGFKQKARRTKERQAMAKILESLHNVHFFTTVITKKLIRKVLFDNKNISLLKKHRYKKDLFIYENKLYSSFCTKNKTLEVLLEELLLLPKEVKRFDRSYIYNVNKTILPTKQNKIHKDLIKKILYKESLYPIMKLLYNARIFKSVFPVAKLIIDQPQFDGYHDLPVDIHSLKALKHLDDIKDCFVKDIYEKMSSSNKAFVRIATFFHDIGKGRKSDHHEAGTNLFKFFAKGIYLEPSDITVIAKLIRYHNIMSSVATNEDIYSQKVILSFTALVKDKEFLEMLYVLTYADINAVGKNIYTSSTASLLKVLYTQSLPAFENVALLSENARRNSKINTIRNLTKFKKLSSLMKKKISYISSNQLFLQLKASEILELAIKTKEVQDFTYKILNDEVLIIRIIRAVPINLGYLLGKLEFLDIASMNIYKLFDEKKCFEIKFSEKAHEEDLTFIEEIVKNSSNMSIHTKLATPNIKENEIIIDCNHTSYLASLKIRTKDQKGLLAHVTKILDDFEIEIESAQLHTSRGKARDLFLIEKNGNFVSQAEKIKELICAKQI